MTFRIFEIFFYTLSFLHVLFKNTVWIYNNDIHLVTFKFLIERIKKMLKKSFEHPLRN